MHAKAISEAHVVVRIGVQVSNVSNVSNLHSGRCDQGLQVGPSKQACRTGRRSVPDHTMQRHPVIFYNHGCPYYKADLNDKQSCSVMPPLCDVLCQLYIMNVMRLELRKLPLHSAMSTQRADRQ